MEEKPQILLIYTGGTIGMVTDYETGALKAFDFKDLIKHVPEIKLLDLTIDAVSFKKPIDSSDITPYYYKQIADMIAEHYSTYDGFVVLHGSDTMAFSASALSFMLEGLQKPVIFTGSQLPVGDLRTDAKENLITAIQLAGLQREGRPLIREVGLYFEYKLYRGNRCTKINSENFNAFDSPNFPPLAVSGVNLKVEEALLFYQKESIPFRVHKSLNQNLVILKIFPGIQPEVVKAVLSVDKLEAVILESYGAGNASSADWFIALLAQAIKKGVHIINISQCRAGRVEMGKYETSIRLKEIGVISGEDMVLEAAVAKAMYLLGLQLPKEAFEKHFRQSLRGEIS